VRDTPAGTAFAASDVAREQPGRATRIGDSRVWLVLMPPPAPVRRRGRHWDPSDDEYDYDDFDRREESQLVVMNGRGGALVVEDGEHMLRHGFYATAGDGPFEGRCGERLEAGQCMWCGSRTPDACDHRLQVAGTIGHLELACGRAGGARSQVMVDALEAVRGLGGEPQRLLDRLVSSVPVAEAAVAGVASAEPAAEGSTGDGDSA